MKAELLPRPREIEEGVGTFDLAGARVVVDDGAAPLEREAARLVAGLLGAERDGALTVRIGTAAGDLPVPDHDQGYALVIDAGGVRLRGATPAGTWHGAQTLGQLIEQEGAAPPALTIRDWPAMDDRGLFVECKWGPDLMSLDDWKRAVDHCAEMKFNHLGVGVYGCWVVQYDGRVTEFLMLPLPEVPGAATPKRIAYHSPADGAERVVEYLPAMFEQDFFGELVAYGKRRGVTVRPQFNSLGHNTLIPRLRPDVSAVGEDGRPTGYGYCVSSPATEELVFRMYDRILDTYLFPNGVRSFHVGLDEVFPSRGIDPADPHRVQEPWCRCPRCREHTPEELFCDWMLRLCAHLAERGVEQIGIWNDQLSRHMDLLDAGLARRIAEAGLADRLVIEWWEYGPRPVHTDIRPELGLRRWVVPMTGYYHWWPYQSYLENVHAMLRMGLEQGATGAESYCTFDPAFDRSYRYQAQLAWNPDAHTDPASFRDAYARWLFGAAAERGTAVMRAFDRAVVEGDVKELVRSLMPYRYTYVAADQPYPRAFPRETLAGIAADRDANRRRLGDVARAAAEAEAGFRELAGASRLIAEHAVESERIEVLATTYLAIMEIEDELGGGAPDRAARAAARLGATICRWDAMMASVEATKEHYLLPQQLRELTTVRSYLVRLRDALRSDPDPSPGLPAAVAAAGAGTTLVSEGGAR